MHEVLWDVFVNALKISRENEMKGAWHHILFQNLPVSWGAAVQRAICKLITVISQKQASKQASKREPVIPLPAPPGAHTFCSLSAVALGPCRGPAWARMVPRRQTCFTTTWKLSGEKHTFLANGTPPHEAPMPMTESWQSVALTVTLELAQTPGVG